MSPGRLAWLMSLGAAAQKQLRLFNVAAVSVSHPTLYRPHNSNATNAQGEPTVHESDGPVKKTASDNPGLSQGNGPARPQDSGMTRTV